jgi:hypothetical protein
LLNLTKALELTIRARKDIAATIELESMILEAIAVETAKSKGSLNLYSALKKIIEKAKKDQVYRKETHGAWIDPISEKQYVANGYYLIEINNPVEGLPQLESGITALNPHGYFRDAGECTAETALDVNAIKVQMKQAEAEARAQNRKVSHYGLGVYKIGLSWYSVVLLMDIISVLGTEVTAHYTERTNAPCFITSSVGRALLMHVKLPEQDEDSGK